MCQRKTKERTKFQSGSRVIIQKGFFAVLYSLQLNLVHSFFSLHLILLNKIVINDGDINWTSSSYISTGEDLLSVVLGKQVNMEFLKFCQEKKWNGTKLN
jgi:hypothetical protein